MSLGQVCETWGGGGTWTRPPLLCRGGGRVSIAGKCRWEIKFVSHVPRELGEEGHPFTRPRCAQHLCLPGLWWMGSLFGLVCRCQRAVRASTGSRRLGSVGLCKRSRLKALLVVSHKS